MNLTLLVALLFSAISIVAAIATVVFVILLAFHCGIALVRPEERRRDLRRTMRFAGLMLLCPVLSALAQRAAAALAAAS